MYACYFYYTPKSSDYMPFVDCIEDGFFDYDIQNTTKDCCKKLNVSFSVLKSCIDGPLGNQLLHANALLTPPHDYVPYVTVNDVHTDDLEQAAENDLIHLICNYYVGPTPSFCRQMLNKKKKKKSLKI